MGKKFLAINIINLILLLILGGGIFYLYNNQKDGAARYAQKNNSETANSSAISSHQDAANSAITADQQNDITGGNAASPVNNPSAAIDFKDSPFGVHPASGGNNYAYAEDLGIKWNREGMYFKWNWIDAAKNGDYNFTSTKIPPRLDGTGGGEFNYDQERVNVNVADMNMMVNICPFNNKGQFASEAEKMAYKKFVEKVVERYDGDENLGCVLSSPDCYAQGDGQYPDSRLIAKFKVNPIRYWQTCNQLKDTCDENCMSQGAYAEKYAETMELTYKGVKAADPTANVLIAGDSSIEEYPSVFKALNGQHVDIIDYHRFSMNYDNAIDWYDPKSDFNFLKSSLQSAGFDTGKLRFWITETGTYSGQPVEKRAKTLAYQDEKQQADQLLKVYVAALANKIEKVFWAWSLVEGFKRSCGFFDYTGLIYDGCDCSSGKYVCSSNLGSDLGRGVKKLSYYTLKKTVAILDGSSWNQTEKIQDADGVHIYKFFKNGQPIWVAWNDNNETKQITISGINSGSVVVTEAVPNFDSGQKVVDYNSAFKTETKTVLNQKITITLGSSPVFVGNSFPAETINATPVGREANNSQQPTPTKQPSQTPRLTAPANNKKCGDGICGSVEKANPMLCPADCQ